MKNFEFIACFVIAVFFGGLSFPIFNWMAGRFMHGLAIAVSLALVVGVASGRSAYLLITPSKK
ncbi:MAG: hypothetical protein JWO13_583 [Acidobacteriales bacterium]|nr:hypothetical protein [Terriglobales bacterium]